MSTTVVRGNVVRFTANFFDAAGLAVAPLSATLYVVYAVDNIQDTDTIAMTATADPTIWEGAWNTDGVEKAPIAWSIRAQIQTSPDLFIVQDGNFALSANAANQVGTHV